jgi:hypothetical protein
MTRVLIGLMMLLLAQQVTEGTWQYLPPIRRKIGRGSLLLAQPPPHLILTRPDRFCSKFLGKYCICGSIELDLLKITKTCQVLPSAPFDKVGAGKQGVIDVVDILFFVGIPHPDAEGGSMGGNDDGGPLFGWPQLDNQSSFSPENLGYFPRSSSPDFQKGRIAVLNPYILPIRALLTAPPRQGSTVRTGPAKSTGKFQTSSRGPFCSPHWVQAKSLGKFWSFGRGYFL